MKSFKQFDEAYTDRFSHTSAEDDNLHLANIQDEKVLQRVMVLLVELLNKSICNLTLL